MIPLYSALQVRKADEFAMNSLRLPGSILMENASISIYNSILEKYPHIDKAYSFGIICGKGNNGGDGYALARHLVINGFNVKVLSIGNWKELQGDAKLNHKILMNLLDSYPHSEHFLYKSKSDINKLSKCEIIIDAILGTGSKGELKEPFGSIVKKLNSLQALKIAVDSPTGLNLDTATGDVIFNAHLTVTLAGMKTGLFYEKGKVNAGKVKLGSIGIGNEFFNSLETDDYLIEPEDVLSSLPYREIDAYKYSVGKVLTIAGSEKLPGAAIFTINAAMISGAGAGILLFPKSLKSLAQQAMNSAIVESYNDENEGILKVNNQREFEGSIHWADSVAIGPGLGRNEETQKAIINILKSIGKKKVIIDADAIFALRNKIYKKVDLQNKVLTPHHKEFADLLGLSLEELKSNLIKYGKSFVKQTGAYLVLKGAPTMIFNPDGECFINSSGNSGLAKFGSGDVLTGIIASFISQQEDVEKSLIASVYLHGLTGDLLLKEESEFGITPQKLIRHFPSTIKFLRKSIV